MGFRFDFNVAELNLVERLVRTLADEPRLHSFVDPRTERRANDVFVAKELISQVSAVSDCQEEDAKQ